MNAERTVALVRHGRTALNREDRLRGLADPPLDDLGLEQAAALAAPLGWIGVGLVLTSPLSRAVRTGQAIAETLGIRLRADPPFGDRDYGPWTGHLRQEVVERFGSVDAAPGVEPVEQVLARARPALDAVLDEEPGVLAIVTHDAVIRPLIAALDPGAGPVRAPNGSWDELRRDEHGWRVLAVDRLP